MMLSLRFGLVAFMVLIMRGDAVPQSIAHWKPTSQSSTTYNGVSERAVDGKTDPIYGSSCTHTNDIDPWWSVDLQGLYIVTSVKIYNRQDCCAERLQNFDIKVGGNNSAAMELCHHQQSPVENMLAINCTNPIQGRHVLIRLLSGNILTLCEVEVFGDAVLQSIAQGKPTSQSSTSFNGVSERAVDGKTDPIYDGSSCTRTNDTDPWWAVDLQGLYNVFSVKIYNRQDCCAERLQNFDIKVGVDNITERELCHHQQSPVENMLAISCAYPLQGRHVFITLLSGNILTLCEVEVFGEAAGVSIANGKPTSQSTVSGGGVSERAVDGNTDSNWFGNACMSAEGPDSWWAVDLQGMYEVISVKIYNRQDCCGEYLQNFDIMVGNNASNPATMEVCYHQQSAVGAMLEISCTKLIRGGHVMIRLLTGTVLTLCEVEVFGSPQP